MTQLRTSYVIFKLATYRIILKRYTSSQKEKKAFDFKHEI